MVLYSSFCLLFLLFLLNKTTAKTLLQNDTIPLTIIHINDFHARFEETNELAGTCKTDLCIGGYARVVTMLKLLKTVYKDENPVYLNAGDNFQGTPWFTQYGWNITTHFLNMHPAHAIAIGNHEFDNGVEGLLPFLNHSLSDMLIANLDENSKKQLKNFTKTSTIFIENGIKIGVIGLTVREANEISNTGNLTFLDEVSTARENVKDLKSKNVSIIVLLTHVGLDKDKKIANMVDDIDIIVGGHSHTHLFTGNNTTPDIAEDEYPVVITRSNGQKTLIVQTAGHAKYVGLLSIIFNKKGEISSWSGNPIYLSHEIQPDPDVVIEIKKWKKDIGNSMQRIKGFSTVPLNMRTCKSGECVLGNLITDSMVYSHKKLDQNKNPLTLTAFVNAGAIRTSLAVGEISYADVITLSPFGNTIDIIQLAGDTILQALEHAVSKKEENMFRGFLQMAGCHVTYDLSKDIGKRVIEAKILDPIRRNYEPIKLKKKYYVITNSFLAHGGDGFFMFKENSTLIHKGQKDSEVLAEYIAISSPIINSLEGRIKFIDAAHP